MRFPFLVPMICLLSFSTSLAHADASKTAHKLEDNLSIQAEEASKSRSIAVLNEGDGARIGVLVRSEESPKAVPSATWSFRTIEAGNYLVEFRYASPEERPGELRLNDRLVSQTSMGQKTRDGKPRSQNWFVQGVFEFEKGVNHLEFQNQGDWANLDQIRLTRRSGSLQLSPEEYKKNCTKGARCEQNVGRTCSLESGTFGPGVIEEKYTTVKRPSAEQYCGIDTHYNVPRKCGKGIQIDSKIANRKDQYDLCGLVRVNRDFCLTERFQKHRFGSLSKQAGKTGQDICDEMLGKLKEADIFLLYR